MNGRRYQTRKRFVFKRLKFTAASDCCIFSKVCTKNVDPVIPNHFKVICTELYLQKIYTYHIMSKMQDLMTVCTYFLTK